MTTVPDVTAKMANINDRITIVLLVESVIKAKRYAWSNLSTFISCQCDGTRQCCVDDVLAFKGTFGGLYIDYKYVYQSKPDLAQSIIIRMRSWHTPKFIVIAHGVSPRQCGVVAIFSSLQLEWNTNAPADFHDTSVDADWFKDVPLRGLVEKIYTGSNSTVSGYWYQIFHHISVEDNRKNISNIANNVARDRTNWRWQKYGEFAWGG